MKKTGRRASRRYFALDAGLAPHCPVLKGRENPELYQTHESREAGRISEDSVPWDGLEETRESREANRNEKDSVPWVGSVPVSWKPNGSLRFFISHCVHAPVVFDSLHFWRQTLLFSWSVVYRGIIIFKNGLFHMFSKRAGCDTRSVCERSLSDLNSVFLFLNRLPYHP